MTDQREKDSADYAYEFLNTLLLGAPDAVGKWTGWWEPTEERGYNIDAAEAQVNKAIEDYYRTAADNLAKQVEEYQKQTQAYLDSLEKSFKQAEIEGKISNAKSELQTAYNSVINNANQAINEELAKIQNNLTDILVKSNSYKEAISALQNSKVGRAQGLARQKLEEYQGKLVNANKILENKTAQLNRKATEYQNQSNQLINQINSGDYQGAKDTIAQTQDLIGQAIDQTPIKKAETNLSDLIKTGGAS